MNEKQYAKLMDLGRQVIAAEKIFGMGSVQYGSAVRAWNDQKRKMKKTRA